MTAYARNATGDYDDSTKWTPNGVPGSTDTATIGAFTVTIATGKTWTPGALALTGTGSSTLAKIVIADGGKLAQYGDITANAYNEVLMQGNSEWDLRGFKTYYTVQTGSNVNNKITNDGLGKAKIYSSTTLGRIAKDATTSSYGCLQLNNFQITNIDFCFGSGYYAGHHYDLQNGVFLAAGYVETSLYANNSSDYRVKRVDLIGCKNPQANVMAHFRADKDVSGGTVTGIRDISKVTFRNEIPLAHISLPSGYTEVTLSSPNLTINRYIGFFFQELVTGDRIWLPATGVTCDTAGQIVATSITNRTIYIVDTSRGVAQPYSISFLPGTFYIDVVTYPQVTWRNLAFAPTEVYYDKVTHSSLLTQGGTLQNFFSANVSAFGNTSRPIRESYIFPAKNNPHTMVNSCLDFQYNILESVQPANSNDGGDHFIVTDAGTHNIMYNLIIDNYGGVCVNALGVASRTGTYNFKHNTYVADARSAVYGGLVRNESSGVFSTASSLNVLDNICHVRSNPTGATSFRAYNLETSGNDQVKTFDNNAYSNCGSPQSSILNGISSATKSIGDNLFGMHDFYSELPGFVDETRGLQKWATQYGATTQEQAVDFVVNGVNGYDPVTMTQISGNVQAQGLTSLIAYVREGFKPTNIAYKDSGTDNITRGAFAYQAMSSGGGITFAGLTVSGLTSAGLTYSGITR